MKYLLCFSVLTSLAVPCLYAQVQPPPVVPSDTPGFLARTAGETSIDTTGIHPWRINISLQLYDAKGKPAETASIDELWGNATHQRIEWTGASFHRVDYITDHGTYRTVSQGVVPMMLEDVRAAIVHPMPSTADVSAAKLTLKTQKVSGKDLNCIMLVAPDAHVTAPLAGNFPTFCFDPVNSRLRVIYKFGSTFIAMNKGGSFQSRSLAMNVDLYQNQIHRASATVEKLRTIAADELALFTPPADALPVGDTPVSVATKVANKNLVKKIDPDYPMYAYSHMETGDIVMHIVIGSSGEVREVRLVDAPDANLANAALSAVREWTYKPYLVKDVPTPMETNISIHYDSDSLDQNLDVPKVQ